MDGRTGLVKTASGWAKVELVGVAASPEFLESRRPSLATPPEPVVDSKRESSDEGGGDARTLFIDFDVQGVRFKDWRAVVQECLPLSQCCS